MSEQRDTVVRKPLSPYVAHHGKYWNIYSSARVVNLLVVVNDFNSLLWLLLFLQLAKLSFNHSNGRTHS